MSDAMQALFTSSGQLPPPDAVQALLAHTHDHLISERGGQVSEVYPALTQADPDLFGLAIVGVQGLTIVAGDATSPFALMSVAKPFTLALAFEDHGIEEVVSRIGIEATGRPFNSADPLDRDDLGRTNPMVNSGAIATASLIAGGSLEEQWKRLAGTLSAFAGRDLILDEEILASASSSNHINRDLAERLASKHVLATSPSDALALYTRQSCLSVSAVDLAVMGATLADGGVNPTTGQPVVSPESARAVLAAMTVAGLYEGSGRWLLDVGLPGKSGIGGGIVTVSPGKGALGTFSPALDAAGNSVRGVTAARRLSRTLGLDILASQPAS